MKAKDYTISEYAYKLKDFIPFTGALNRFDRLQKYEGRLSEIPELSEVDLLKTGSFILYHITAGSFIGAHLRSGILEKILSQF